MLGVCVGEVVGWGESVIIDNYKPWLLVSWP